MKFNETGTRLMTFTLAAVLAALVSVPVYAQDSPIGHIIIATSDIKALGDDGERALKRRSPVYEGDTVFTPVGGKVQIRFVDGTIMTLMSDTTFKVDEYRSQARGDRDDAMRTSLLKGGLRSVTGSIAKTSPDAFKVNTAVATIGIRGTHFSIDYVRDGLFFGASKDNIDACNENGCLAVGDDYDSKYGFVGIDREFRRLTDEEAMTLTLHERGEEGDIEQAILLAVEEAKNGDDSNSTPPATVVDETPSFSEMVTLAMPAPANGVLNYDIPVSFSGGGFVIGLVGILPYTYFYNATGITWGAGIKLDFNTAKASLTNNIKIDVIKTFQLTPFIENFISGEFVINSTTSGSISDVLVSFDAQTHVFVSANGTFFVDSEPAFLALELPDLSFSGSIDGVIRSEGERLVGNINLDTTGLGSFSGTYTLGTTLPTPMP